MLLERLSQCEEVIITTQFDGLIKAIMRGEYTTLAQIVSAVGEHLPIARTILDTVKTNGVEESAKELITMASSYVPIPAEVLETVVPFVVDHIDADISALISALTNGVLDGTEIVNEFVSAVKTNDNSFLRHFIGVKKLPATLALSHLRKLYNTRSEK